MAGDANTVPKLMPSIHDDRTETRRDAYRKAAEASNAKRYRRHDDHHLVPDDEGSEWVLEGFLESIKAEKCRNRTLGKALNDAEKTFRHGWRKAMKDLKKAGKGEPVFVLTPEGIALAYRRS